MSLVLVAVERRPGLCVPCTEADPFIECHYYGMDTKATKTVWVREMDTERPLEFDQVQFICHNRFIKQGAWASTGSKDTISEKKIGL